MSLILTATLSRPRSFSQGGTRRGSRMSSSNIRPIDEAVHHYLLNRGVIVTPFHNMMLISPETKEDHVEQLVCEQFIIADA